MRTVVMFIVGLLVALMSSSVCAESGTAPLHHAPVEPQTGEPYVSDQGISIPAEAPGMPTASHYVAAPVGDALRLSLHSAKGFGGLYITGAAGISFDGKLARGTSMLKPTRLEIYETRFMSHHGDFKMYVVTSFSISTNGFLKITDNTGASYVITLGPKKECTIAEEEERTDWIRWGIYILALIAMAIGASTCIFEKKLKLVQGGQVARWQASIGIFLVEALKGAGAGLLTLFGLFLIVAIPIGLYNEYVPKDASLWLIARKVIGGLLAVVGALLSYVGFGGSGHGGDFGKNLEDKDTRGLAFALGIPGIALVLVALYLLKL